LFGRLQDLVGRLFHGVDDGTELACHAAVLAFVEQSGELARAVREAVMQMRQLMLDRPQVAAAGGMRMQTRLRRCRLWTAFVGHLFDAKALLLHGVVPGGIPKVTS